MIVPINPDEHGPSGTNHLAVLFDLHVYQCSFQRGASNLQGDGRKPFPARNRVHEWGRKRTLSPFFQRITIIGDGFDIRNPLSMNILFPVRPEPGKQVFHGIIQKRRFPVPQRKPHPFEKQLFIITITAQEPIGSQNGHASVDEDGVFPVPLHRPAMFPSSRRKRCKSHGNYPFAAPPRCTPPVRKKLPPVLQPVNHAGKSGIFQPHHARLRQVRSVMFHHQARSPEFHRASSPSGCGTLKSRRRKRPAPHIPSPKRGFIPPSYHKQAPPHREFPLTFR